MARTVLIGGPYDGARPDLLYAPETIDIRGDRYRRINDPDTGEYLGGYGYAYAYQQRVAPDDVVAP